MVSPIQRTEGTQNVNKTQNTNNGIQSVNTVNVTKKTSAYLATEAKLTKAEEKLEELKETNPKRYAELKKVYDNSTRVIHDNGTVEFTIKGSINPKDFIIAYGIDDGALLDYLDDRHKKDMASGRATAVPQGKASADETMIWYENAAQPGEHIDFTDGMRYIRARGWLSGELYNKRDCTKMELRSGETVKIHPSWINNKRNTDEM